jgi:hypothetical protein
MTRQPSWRSFADRIGDDGLALLAGLIVALIGLFLYRDATPALGLRDADDYMRLAQVRDLMAGQSWFDVTQYRVNPGGGGGLMHWSRFIDAQIAGLIWLLTPLLGPEMGERWAAAIYPPLLMLPLFILIGRILARLGDRRLIVAGLFVAATSVTFLHYFAPLRIDHHNWQLLLSVAMLWLALGPASFRRGLAAALVIAAHVEISLEGFPYLAIFGALFALEWLRDAKQAPRLAGFAAGLVVIPSLWLLVFRGPQALLAVHCDAFTQPYVAGVAAAGAVLAGWLTGPAMLRATWVRRVAGLVAAGAGGAGVFLIFGQTCLDGPFGALEPLVRTYWYDVVREGRPVWDQIPSDAALFVAPTLIGLGATLWAWRRAPAGPMADAWRRLSFVALCGGLLSMLVFRTTATAHAYLVTGFGALLLALWDWSRARPTALGRVGGVLLVLAALPACESLLASRAVGWIVPSPYQSAEGHACPTPEMLAGLARAKPALVFATVDIGPTLLVWTPHSVIATGHHRNHAAMNRVITAFLSSPETAEPIVRASGATWLALCTRLPEVDNLSEANPAGLAARLARGESVGWLRPEPALSRDQFAVYRVLPGPQAGRKVSAAPFMQ